MVIPKFILRPFLLLLMIGIAKGEQENSPAKNDLRPNALRNNDHHKNYSHQKKDGKYYELNTNVQTNEVVVHTSDHDRELQVAAGAFGAALTTLVAVYSISMFIDLLVNVVNTPPPSIQPSKRPTKTPTKSPSMPSVTPSKSPVTPSLQPSLFPSSKPTVQPSLLSFLNKYLTFIFTTFQAFLPDGNITS